MSFGSSLSFLDLFPRVHNHKPIITKAKNIIPPTVPPMIAPKFEPDDLELDSLEGLSPVPLPPPAEIPVLFVALGEKNTGLS
jgi:hypothetical protein